MGRKQSAFIQISVLFLLVASALFFYQKEMIKKAHVHKMLSLARQNAKSIDQEQLLAAQNAFSENITEVDKDSLTILTEVELILSYLYNNKEALQKGQLNLYKLRTMVQGNMLIVLEIFNDLAEKKYQVAESRALKAINDGMSNQKVFLALSLAQQAQGKDREAEESARKGLRLQSSFEPLLWAEGQAALKQFNALVAKNRFALILTTNPNNLLARIGMLEADMLLQQENTEKMANTLEQIVQEISKKPSDYEKSELMARLNYIKSELALKRKDFSQAKQFAEQALQGERVDAQGYFTLARIASRTDMMEEAQENFSKALDVEPCSRMIARTAFHSFVRIEKIEVGIQFMLRVRDANPSDPYMHIDLSEAYAEQSNTTSAQASAEKAAQLLGQDNELVLYARAKNLLSEGKTDLAREEFKKAAEKAGKGWGDLFFQMARLNLKEKDIASAIQLFNEAERSWELEKPIEEELISDLEIAGRELKGADKNASDGDRYLQRAKNLLGS